MGPRFDLDHLRSQIRQDTGNERTGTDPAEIQHSQTCKPHRTLSSFARASGEAGLAVQKRAIVLTEFRCRAARARRRAAEPIGRPGKGDLPARDGFELWLEIRVRRELRVLQNVGDGVYRRNRDLAGLTFAIELLLAARPAERAEDFGKSLDPFARLAVLEVLPLRFEQRRPVRQLGARDPLRQRHESLGGAEPTRHHADVTVLARIDAGAGLTCAVAEAPAHVGIDRPFRHRVLERERYAFLPGHVDPATLAGLRALEQS